MFRTIMQGVHVDVLVETLGEEAASVVHAYGSKLSILRVDNDGPEGWQLHN